MICIAATHVKATCTLSIAGYPVLQNECLNNIFFTKKQRASLNKLRVYFHNIHLRRFYFGISVVSVYNHFVHLLIWLFFGSPFKDLLFSAKFISLLVG